MSGRPKRLHRNPYGNLMQQYIKEGDEALQALGITPPARPTTPPVYEPSEGEVFLYREACLFVQAQFGADLLRAALQAAGIQDGELDDDDLDIDVYISVLDYVKRQRGIEVELRVTTYLDGLNRP